MRTPSGFRFVNLCDQGHLYDIAFFQENRATNRQIGPVAWKIVRHCPYGWTHPIPFDQDLKFSVGDYYGNFSNPIPAIPGQLAMVTQPPFGGYQVQVRGKSPCCLTFQGQNALQKGALHFNIFKAGRVLACESAVPPGQPASFRFDSVLWVAVTSGAVEGKPLKQAGFVSAPTALNLHGLSGADIINSGGGAGPHASPIHFALHNQTRA